MKKVFFLFPNQLFEIKYLIDKKMRYILVEHPIFFKKNFNKLKLIFHRASMQYYYDYLKKNKISVSYIKYQNIEQLKSFQTVHMFDVLDNELEKSLYFKEIIIYESPNFLCTRDDLEEYSQLDNKKFYHKNFYEWQVKRLGLNIRKSYDKQNRKTLKSDKNIPPLLNNEKSQEYIKGAIKYIHKNFPQNKLGSDNLIFPVTHFETKKWFKDFLKNKLHHFGDYQDAILMENGFLYHSLLSPMMNIGLINPDYIIEETTKYYKKHNVKKNNYEGFIRQIIGWREYQRMIYIYQGENIRKMNFFNNKRKLTNNWYNGTTGIIPVDDCIKQAFQTGYLHHIQRLMIMSNFMNLCGIHPDEVYNWFMEFSCDSYDWVMIGNVYSMGLFADGGKTMTRPYISSDNYIMKMSNYDEGEWNEKWRALYHGFLDRHKNKKFYRYPVKINKELVKRANSIIKKLTK